jgi:hypothetical protein
MLRAVIAMLAASMLAAACALVEQPPPPGTRVINAEVRNLSSRPLELMVQTSQTRGALPGAVRPSSVPPGETARVTIYVPTAGEWSILIDPTSSMNHEDFERFMAQGCTMILIETDGAYGSASCE